MNMLALRAKTDRGWALTHAPVPQNFFRYVKNNCRFPGAGGNGGRQCAGGGVFRQDTDTGKGAGGHVPSIAGDAPWHGLPDFVELYAYPGQDRAPDRSGHQHHTLFISRSASQMSYPLQNALPMPNHALSV